MSEQRFPLERDAASVPPLANSMVLVRMLLRSCGIAEHARTIGLVLLLGVSYMFNSMDRQVFPALLTSVRADYSGSDSPLDRGVTQAC
jgi:hypothetical protein